MQKRVALKPAMIKIGLYQPLHPTMALTPKLQRFLDEYLLDFNQVKAAERAGYSKKSASYIHRVVNNNSEFQQQLALKVTECNQRIQLDQDRALLEIARLALNDPRQAFDSNGVLLPIHDWPDDLAAAVSSIKIHELKTADGTVIGVSKEIKFWDKTKSLSLLAHYFGLLQTKIEVKTPLSELIRAARERLKCRID